MRRRAREAGRAAAPGLLLSAVLVCASALAASCGGALAGGTGNPFQQPVQVRQVPMGLNDGWHSPLPTDVVNADCAYRQPFTIRTPQISGPAIDAFIASIGSCATLRTLALVEGPDPNLAAQFALSDPWGIELGNELELAPHNLTLDQYVTFIKAAHDAVRRVNPTVTIITGGVYALTPDTKDRILAATYVCRDCWIGVHLYEPPTADDIAFLSGLKAPVAITETGYPTKCDANGAYQQQQFLDQMIYQLSTVPNVQLITVYQRPIGPTCSALDTFGLQPGVDVALFGQKQ